VIEIVADPEKPAPDTDWFIREFGGGVMIGELKSLGRVFTGELESCPRLEFVRRADL